jgi:hypothetical protein
MSDAADAFENSALLLFFNATTWDGVAENDTTSPVTAWQFGLHTSDPGEAGNQTTNEIGYTSYARASVNRNGGGFTVATNAASLAANRDFPAGTGGSGTATHLGLGTASSGTGALYIRGAITPNIVCGNGVTPRLTTGTQFTLN